MRQIGILALLLAIGLVLHSVERVIPVPQVAPGVKLGLANIASLIGLFCLPYPKVLVLVVLRSLLSSLFGGGLASFWFSVVGGVASATAMYAALVYGSRVFSFVSVSIIGALVHNIGQLAVASVVTGAPRIYLYLPVLIVSGSITGFIVGLVSLVVLRRLVCVDALSPMFSSQLCERFLFRK